MGLIGLFISISLYLILLDLVFIGLSYLIVYVGAVSILFIFILMLINIRLSELYTSKDNSILLSLIILMLTVSIKPLININNIKLSGLNSYFDYFNDYMFEYNIINKILKSYKLN
jgi:NADH-ubiquinone oxidoreductase chain 6